jgi:hypothetical protein
MEISREATTKRLSSWKGKLLSLDSRLVLINSALANMVLYMISFFILPKGVLHKLYYYRSRILWQGTVRRKNIVWLNEVCLCRPKDQEGLGIHDLQVKNMNLLDKWLFKLLTEDGIWQTHLKIKICWLKGIITFFFKKNIW